MLTKYETNIIKYEISSKTQNYYSMKLPACTLEEATNNGNQC